MIFFPLALLLAASPVVKHYAIDVPRGDWIFVDVKAPEQSAVVNCEFEAENGPIRIVWIARKDLDRFRAGKRDAVIEESDFITGGEMREVAPAAGDYAIVVESEPKSREQARVKMKVWVSPAAHPKLASTQRRLTVILLSCVTFAGIVSYSAYKIRRA